MVVQVAIKSIHKNIKKLEVTMMCCCGTRQKKKKKMYRLDWMMLMLICLGRKSLVIWLDDIAVI